MLSEKNVLPRVKTFGFNLQANLLPQTLQRLEEGLLRPRGSVRKLLEDRTEEQMGMAFRMEESHGAITW